MFPLNDDNLIELKRHHESLGDEGINQPIPQGSFEFAFHIEEGYESIEVIPDEGTHIGHDD